MLSSRMRWYTLLAASLAVCLAGCGGARHGAASTDAPAAPSGSVASTQVEVYLLQGEGLKPVRRQLAAKTVATAVAALLKGPTTGEAKADIRTQVPKATRLLRASVSGGTATIDLSRPYVEGTDKASLRARLAQLVWTATAVPNVTGVRLWIDDRAPTRWDKGSRSPTR